MVSYSYVFKLNKVNLVFFILFFFPTYIFTATIFPLTITKDPDHDKEVMEIKNELEYAGLGEKPEVLLDWLVAERSRRRLTEMHWQAEKDRLNDGKRTIQNLKTTMKDYEMKYLRIALPLSVHNKARQIEASHPDIKGTIPDDHPAKSSSFAKPILERQYQWMELLNCKNDTYIQKINEDLQEEFPKRSDKKVIRTFDEFKLAFCFSIAKLVNAVTNDLEQFKFEGMFEDFEFGLYSDPGIHPYLIIFYNSVVRRGQSTSSTHRLM